MSPKLEFMYFNGFRFHGTQMGLKIIAKTPIPNLSRNSEKLKQAESNDHASKNNTYHCHEFNENIE